MFFPGEPSQGRKSLFDVIRSALLQEGALTVYDPGVRLRDDDFQRALTSDQLDSLMNPSVTTWTASLDDPDLMIPVVQPAPMRTMDVTRYQLKEDWVFDKQRGVMEVRIIGLAPMREVRWRMAS